MFASGEKVMSDFPKYIVYTCGGQGIEAMQVLERINSSLQTIKILGFVDDDEAKTGRLFYNYPVLGTSDFFVGKSDVKAVIPVADPELKKVLMEKSMRRGVVSFPVVIDPSVIKGSDAIIGFGTVISPFAILTVGVTLGNFVRIDIGAMVAHSTTVGSFTTISPGARINGGVNIGSSCRIGANAVILPNLDITDNVVVGAGAVVTRSIKKEGTYIGIPARERG